VFHDRTGASNPRKANLGLDVFPSPPPDQWVRCRAWKRLDAEAERGVLQDYFDDGEKAAIDRNAQQAN
jgi:type I restriction enzyme R subunit